MDGLELLRTVRDRFDAPTIVLTGRDSESERIAGLDIGADDYVTKPFSPRELMSRIGAVLRRSSPHADAPMSFGSLVIDPVKREALLHGEEVALTRREFDLLLHFAQHPNQAFSKGELLEEVWQSNIDWQDADTVTEHVRRVRRKVDDPGSPSRIVTLRGIGYRFEP
jgi:DNA-binding response OmpR family regulator